MLSASMPLLLSSRSVSPRALPLALGEWLCVLSGDAMSRVDDEKESVFLYLESEDTSHKTPTWIRFRLSEILLCNEDLKRVHPGLHIFLDATETNVDAF